MNITNSPEDNSKEYWVLLVIMHFIILVVGFLGNAFVLAVYTCSRKPLCTMDAYLINLSVSDLLLAFTCLFYLTSLIDKWIFGEAMCKIISLLNETVFTSSMFTVACIACDQYFATVKSSSCPIRKNAVPTYIKVMLPIIWLLSLLIGIPDYFVYEEETTNATTQCNISLDLLTKQEYYMILVLQVTFPFFIPLIAILFCYVAILFKVRSTSILQKRRVYKTVLGLISVFLLLEAPYHICIFMEIITISTTWDEITFLLAAFSSCIHPFLYALLWKKFRKRVIKITPSFAKNGKTLKKAEKHSDSSKEI
ncbi:C-X-C chemokine receptor type 2-like [Erpetoichthys calabaricus]|uniref:C-X-C chemokine receptor type 2-like n=1 Tax=Erpetoichthys calabaricus TaxID=27687 RepID=UPI00109F6E3A|nr:C-X-C chemokine receptor type 2-like [Erpetoichthys calabaricus]